MELAREMTGSGKVERDFFVRCMTEKMKDYDGDDTIRQMYAAFDVGCRGFLTLEDAVAVFSEVAPWCPLHTVEIAFRVADRNGDGRVGFAEFARVMEEGARSDALGIPSLPSAHRARMVPPLRGVWK